MTHGDAERGVPWGNRDFSRLPTLPTNPIVSSKIEHEVPEDSSNAEGRKNLTCHMALIQLHIRGETTI